MHPIHSLRALALAAGLVAALGAWAPAQAAISLDHFTVIVGGWQLERRCTHLDAGKHDTLGRIAARAELEAAGAHGADKVTEVLEGAEAFGKEQAGNCGAETREAVRRSYSIAVQFATARSTENRPRRDETVTALQPSRKRLVRFGAQTEAYYLQRRCRHLPYKQDLAFWKLIRKQHYALIAKFGAGAVGRVSRRAKHNANRASVRCGVQTETAVYDGLHAIRRDVSSQ